MIFNTFLFVLPKHNVYNNISKICRLCTLITWWKILTYIILILYICSVHHLQQLDLDLGLIEEGFLVLDDFDGDMALLRVIECFHHLPKGTFADEGVYLVSLQEFLSVLHYVVMVVIVKAIVVDFALLLVRAVLPLDLGRPSLLFGIIYLENTVLLFVIQLWCIYTYVARNILLSG